MDYDSFVKLIDDEALPGRLVDYYDHFYIPTQEEIEKASEFLQKGETEDSSYFSKYNNQIFL